jgi:capsular polysaccharide export protein
MTLNQGYPRFLPHRKLSVYQEFKLYIKRLTLIPLHAINRRIASLRIKLGNFPYHLALLQLEHDASFQAHGPFTQQAEFVEAVLSGFAAGASSHHHMVFKAHPLEDGRSPLRSDIRRIAREYGLGDRVHFIGGGKLATLLDEARSAVTVNSTAGQQALWRGIPLKVFGSCVYDKGPLISRQELEAFFRAPKRSDPEAYRIFRDFLLATSQLPGSFYASRGRRQLLRRVGDMMLASDGPYELARPKTEAVEQHISLVQ